MQKNRVQAYLLDKKGGALELNYEELNSVNRDGKILWVHFDYSSPEAIDWITNKGFLRSCPIMEKNLSLDVFSSVSFSSDAANCVLS